MRLSILMESERTIWILPSRGQEDDETVLEDGSRRQLTEALDVSLLPKEMAIGVPEELLTGLSETEVAEVLFAQFFRRDYRKCGPHKNIFSLSFTCGKDSLDRTVYMTLIQVLKDKKLPKIPGPADVPVQLEAADRKAAKRVLTRLAQPGTTDCWAKAVCDMLDAVKKHPDCKSFASTRLPRAAYRSQWPKRGLSLPGLAGILSIAGVVCLIALTKSCSKDTSVGTDTRKGQSAPDATVVVSSHKPVVRPSNYLAPVVHKSH